MEVQARNRVIIKYNVAGIIMNLLLSISKIVIGSIFNSHAIRLDGINSLADMVSSALSIGCTVIGSKKASKNHPFGYGRMEYISSMIVTMLVMYVGVQSIIGSVQVIIHPDDAPQYTPLVIIVMVISLLAKATYGILMRIKGRKINSIVMRMAGTESLGDSLVSVAIIVAMVVYSLTGKDIEHYLCIAISLLILYTGVRMIIESLTKILGARPDPELKKNLIRLFIEENAVQNVSNIVLHNYGENIYVGSADIEVDENMSAGDISVLSRKLIEKAKGCNVTMTSIGVSGTNLGNPETDKIWDQILTTALKYQSIVKVHSFHADLEAKDISFSVVQNFDAKKQERERKELLSEIEKAFPDMAVEIYTLLNA